MREIGLPGIRVRTEDPRPAQMLWRRVSDEERQANLEELLAISKNHGIELLLIHPSYRRSVPHKCILTSFSEAHELELFDAQQILHQNVSSRMYLDAWHPSGYGHEVLAESLADEIEARRESVAREDRGRGAIGPAH